MKILKQVLGTDVAQKELVVSLGRLLEDLTVEIYATKIFSNTPKGFVLLLAWVKKLTDPSIAVRFVMEATGVYHESLAYFLTDQSEEVSIVLPNKISNYFRTLDVKTITDNTASEAIARFGLERKLDRWKRPDPLLKRLRQLTRERDQIVEQRTMAKNHLHAEKAEAEPNDTSVKRINKHILFLDKQEKEVKDEIAVLTKKDQRISHSVEVLTSAPGIGLLTAVTVLAETNGFELIRNKRQLASYAGLDVREKQSGTSVKGKPKISKRGNRYLRKAMHLPALAAIRSNEQFKGVFARLVARHGIKMKAAVAVQRKLLELMYTLYKTNTPYDKDFLNRQAKKEKQPLQ
jgi:transposase